MNGCTSYSWSIFHGDTAMPQGQHSAWAYASGSSEVFTKHGADFRLKGNLNPGRAADASRVIHQHVNSSAVRVIEGTYRGTPVTHFVNPKTGLNVVADPAGNFVSGWRLGAEQLESVLTTGRLF